MTDPRDDMTVRPGETFGDWCSRMQVCASALKQPYLLRNALAAFAENGGTPPADTKADPEPSFVCTTCGGHLAPGPAALRDHECPGRGPVVDPPAKSEPAPCPGEDIDPAKFWSDHGQALVKAAIVRHARSVDDMIGEKQARDRALAAMERRVQRDKRHHVVEWALETVMAEHSPHPPHPETLAEARRIIRAVANGEAPTKGDSNG